MSATVLRERLAGSRVVVCAGPGGVGKTTTAAAVALLLAGEGRRVAVVTIDPARRLADALGVGELGNDPSPVPAAVLARLGVDLAAGGSVSAVMLDPKATFDALVGELAPDEAAAEEVRRNPIYRRLSSAVGGTQEFTAVARLHDLAADDRFDVVVLDTPPSRNAMDFLDAPERISGFLEGRALGALLGNGRSGLAGRLVGRGTGAAFAVLERLTGVDVLRDLSVFLRAIGPLSGGFAARAGAVAALLRAPSTRFLIVTSPAPVPAREAAHLVAHLREQGMRPAALVANRAHVLPPGRAGRSAEDVRGDVEGELGAELAARVARTWEDHRRLAARDAEVVAWLAARLREPRPVVVGLLDHDVADLDALAQVRDALLDDG